MKFTVTIPAPGAAASSRRPGRTSQRLRRGLSLVEALISLAICGMLLTAVAGSFSASAQAVENNDQFFRATQAARVSLNHILTQLRRVEEIEIDEVDQSISFFKLDSGTGLEEEYTYKYFPADRELRLIHSSDPDQPQYRLASNVEGVLFDQDTDDINGDNVQFVVRVSVTIHVKVGVNEIRLSGSAVPRRNLRYQ